MHHFLFGTFLFFDLNGIKQISKICYFWAYPIQNQILISNNATIMHTLVRLANYKGSKWKAFLIVLCPSFIFFILSPMHFIFFSQYFIFQTFLNPDQTVNPNSNRFSILDSKSFHYFEYLNHFLVSSIIQFLSRIYWLHFTWAIFVNLVHTILFIVSYIQKIYIQQICKFIMKQFS